LTAGRVTEPLERARAESVPTFTRFLDLPILFLIVALGVIRLDDWKLFIAGTIVSLGIAGPLTIYIPRLNRWITRGRAVRISAKLLAVRRAPRPAIYQESVAT